MFKLVKREKNLKYSWHISYIIERYYWYFQIYFIIIIFKLINILYCWLVLWRNKV